MRYFKSQEVPCWTKQRYSRKSDMLWWGAPGEVDVDHKFAAINNVLRFLRRIGLPKQPGQAEVFVRCSIRCKCPVHKFLPYAICPQISAIDLLVKFWKLQRIQELPLHQSLECPKLNCRVWCVGPNQFLHLYCVLLHQVQVKIPKDHKQWHSFGMVASSQKQVFDLWHLSCIQRLVQVTWEINRLSVSCPVGLNCHNSPVPSQLTPSKVTLFWRLEQRSASWKRWIWFLSGRRPTKCCEPWDALSLLDPFVR